MIATPINGEDAVAAYEKLRSRVLASSTPGSQKGLPLLIREGISAWIRRYPARAVPSLSVNRKTTPPQVPRVSNELHDGIVRLLATMALTGRKEYAHER